MAILCALKGSAWHEVLLKRGTHSNMIPLWTEI